MAKGQSIKRIEPLITEIYNRMYGKDPKVTAKEVQAEVHAKLKSKYKDRPLPPDWPGVSAVGKVITEINKKRAQLGPDLEDRPWSTVSLAKYPIPPEALPIVLRVWARLQTRDPDKRNTLTIREALWVSRLYCLIKQEADETDTDYLDRCWGHAHSLATAEKVLNSAKGGYPEERIDLLYYWLNDASLYNKMAGIESFAGDLLDQFSEEFVDKAWPLYHQKWLDKKKQEGGKSK